MIPHYFFMKLPKKRLEILNNYKENVWRFLKFNLLAFITILYFQLILRDNPFSITLLPLTILLAAWIFLLISLFLLSLNNNLFLYVASLVTLVYILSLNYELMSFVWLFMTYSFIYEMIIKFSFGVWFKIIPQKYSWCDC